MEQLHNTPLISVCIPVFETESYLTKCLRSVYTQNFDSFEIVVVSDASRGVDDKKRTAKKIVKDAQKESNIWRKKNGFLPIQIRYIEHRENRGLIEVRRTLMYESRAFYLTQVDSDDQMEAGALSSLWKASKYFIHDTNLQYFDIVHGTSTAGIFDENNNFISAKENKYGKIFYGTLEGHEVFSHWILKGDFTANTWGKLIKRELWQKAYENIPYTECNMADDVLLFFFIAQYARSYIGIENKVYRYRVNTGMTSVRKIDSIHKWKMIAQTASVFTVISSWINEHPDALLPKEVESVKVKTRFYLQNNLLQLREAVVPELQEEARSLLCEYWGESFVCHIEEFMDNKASKC